MLIGLRDLYYREPELFKKQETVDRYLDDIAHTCKVSRNDLKVVSLRASGCFRTNNQDRKSQRSCGRI